MNIHKLKFSTELQPSKGRLLISEPTLPDKQFHRSVIYMCGHNEEGSLGFILNRKLQDPLSYFIEDVQNAEVPLYVGGPVDLESIHFIHTAGALLGGVHVQEDVYFGGDFEQAIDGVRDGSLNEDNIKFFLGYSGWSSGQLEAEIAEKSWLVSDTPNNLLFSQNVDELWREAILNLDASYHDLLKMPHDPSLN